MPQKSSLENSKCQPILAHCGKKAKLNFKLDLTEFKSLNFCNPHGFFNYEIKICKFDSKIFSSDISSYFAYLVQVYVESDNHLEQPFQDTNIFLEKNFEDFVEYCIILPRLFKRHHRYVIDFESDRVCTFNQFGEKVKLWKKLNGLT